jgi:glycosyltransferase involved in cell wall biosynthesis
LLELGEMIKKIKIAVLYPCDPLGMVIGGIESFVRGLIQNAPEHIAYTVFGATTSLADRPIGVTTLCKIGDVEFEYHPIMVNDTPGTRPLLPATLKYEFFAPLRLPSLTDFDYVETHRMEHLLLRRVSGKANLFIHNNMASIYNKHSDILWSKFPWLYFKLEQWVFSKCKNVMCVSADAVSNYCRQYPHWSSKFIFQPTWMNPDIFSPNEDSKRKKNRQQWLDDYSLPDDTTLLVAVGRIDRQKNPQLLLDVCKILKNESIAFHLVWIGDGILMSDVKVFVEENGLERNVALIGLQSASAIADFLRSADIFCLSSAYEGMPISVLEALACGCPVVSTDVGEIRRLVFPGVNGEISNQDVQCYTNALKNGILNFRQYRGLPCLAVADTYMPKKVLSNYYESL